MIEIKDLLSRWGNILLAEEAKKDVVAQAVEQAIGQKINSKDIEIKNGTVYLNLNPVYKNEIFIKREKILEQLSELIGERAPREIR